MAQPGEPVALSAEEKAWIVEFLQSLSEEENRISQQLARDHRGVLLAGALKELDLHETFIAENGLEEELSYSFYFLSMGLRRLAILMLSLHSDFPFPAITMPRSEDLARRVTDLATILGFIEHGRRVVELTWSGLSTITKVDPKLYRFDFPSKIIDAQSHERGVEEHYRDILQNEIGRNLFETPEGKIRSEKIWQSFLGNIYVWRDLFMGYNADPFLDDIFFTIAWGQIVATPQFDSFNELKKFGGITYLKYLMSAAIVVSFALKHERFAAAMNVKYPDIPRGNVLTISADREEFIDDLWHALEEFGERFAHYTPTSRAEAEQLFKTVTLNRENVAVASRPHAPLPVIVEFASTSIVKVVSGRARQMEFLLDSLRRNFQSDYSSNQRGREASLQRALTGFLQSMFPDVICRTNIKLRYQGRVLTDVDLVAFDPIYGDLMLFQLKHQDTPGPDLKAENSRMPRFLRECSEWLDVVADWLGTADETILRNAFRLPRGAKISRVRKLIVARHHAYPLAGTSIDENTAYATWLQFYNAGRVMIARQGNLRSMNGLFAFLREHIVRAPVRHHQEEQPKRFRLHDLEYEIVQRKN
ncbi:hypothetical protein [Sphingobium nicotianae]|uniref:Restriction endonuclease n=1 Tax=Sphingobium nicotianae TaxID=2782607 RepID=A0A9X1ITJ9_9SPHN|nr:hypothetical protein [Sphingobium nicotianae]MBT2189450.1 hypothetical protein [Sphingobium nicotianae]